MAFLYFDYCLLFFGEIMETKMITFGEKTDNYPFATSLASSVATCMGVSLKMMLRKFHQGLFEGNFKKMVNSV